MYCKSKADNMDNTIKIISEILIREYYDLESAFRKILKSISSYTFDYNKIDDFVEMVDYDGIEYIINGFYHNDKGNMVLNVANKETDEETTLNTWNYNNIVVFKNILDAINKTEFTEED